VNLTSLSLPHPLLPFDYTINRFVVQFISFQIFNSSLKALKQHSARALLKGNEKRRESKLLDLRIGDDQQGF